MNGFTGTRTSPTLPILGWKWLAALCAVALLFSFARTVQLVVAQGNDRRAQIQQRADEAARCNGMAQSRARAECRAGGR